ncbi:SF1B family DNA helicase RecD2 [Lacticaseibacillus saniviri]|uniref:ATP-dependent RecD2 DNA helicase n=1 Tax=Lacticaseibacillus saniviri JCM 17471 = DSM 24301 TaxID=1293598 RepID=A0A0R2MXS4_9LACO|nr:ATP-dependent RecD-like DNA helicase [Lacticaseibacillus saniviri]KRO18357.1 ATP-dependent exoDNAse [Lacticaseibacillus saniviri JCM 17471 = DSM 24301]MCG4282191.1 ATP-dependent RecD-like DNA helicase [Lacticaseibacillus saniviri]
MATLEQDTVTGRIKSIFFQNPTNFYKILLVEITATTITWPEAEIVVTGSFGDIKEDGVYTFVGHVINHPKYGNQFQADNYSVEKPTTKQGLVQYLSSDKFPGIGEKTAERIVDSLGVGAIDKILKEPKVLRQLGLNAAKTTTLVENLKANLGMEQVIIGLNDYGFSSNLAAKIYQQYQTDALDVIEENPYRLIGDIDGIGFKRADAIAAKLNITPDDPMRISGALIDTLQQQTDGTGDTYCQLDTLVKQTINLLESARNIAIDPNLVADSLIQLGKSNQVIADGKRIFPKRLFDAENNIAARLKRLMTDAEAPDEAAIKKALKTVEKEIGIDYDPVQRDAILTAIKEPFFMLTGGPGTGKTTVINGIVRVYAALNDLSLDINKYNDETKPFPIMLAAPTGRASKRMTETTGLPASTIHRLLGLSVDTQDFEPKELPDGLLIVDEMSMVDTYLFRTLLNSLHADIKLILVGDKDQLPSVGPGQVFADLLSSHVLPSQELTHIHRQDATSSIIPLAHAINRGELPADLLKPQADRSFFVCPPEQIQSVVAQVIQKAQGKFAPLAIQILAPMYRGTAGIDALNPLAQSILNPKKSERTKEVESGDQKYRIGDKVLQLVNNPEQNVFNGEIGVIQGITPAKQAESKTDELTIDFDGNELTYKRSDWQKFTLAYATSIHKAQGSEFDLVILPLTLQSRRMLRRNLIYTAITRAKDFLILVGDPRAFELAVTQMADNRQTGLVEKLQEAFGDHSVTPPVAPKQTPETASEPEVEEAKGSYQLTPELVQTQAIDPMIGMADLTPAAFMPK